MAVNLIELATRHLPDNVVERVSRRLGENPQPTQAALNGALPVMLNGLVQRSAQPGGTSSVMDLVAGMTTPDRVAGEIVMPQGAMISRLGSLANGKNDNDDNSLLDHLESMGGSITTSLFGDRGGAVAGALASHSGVNQSSALSVLNLAGPVLLAVLGQKLHEDGDGPTGLAALLKGQAGYVQSAMPSGLQSVLGSLPGSNTPGGMGETPVRPAESVTPAPATTVSTANSSGPTASGTIPPAGADRPVAGIPAFNSEHTAGSGRETRWLPWLLLALGVIALIFVLRSCRTDESRRSAVVTTDSSSALGRRENTAGAVEATADSVAESTTAGDSVATDVKRP